MAFVAVHASNEPRSFSLGPLKLQLMDFSAASGDTSGTATADSLSSVQFCILIGLTQTAQPTLSGNVATLAFADPAATVYGKILMLGR